MGISEIVKELKSERLKRAGQRLFKYSSDRALRQRLPLKLGDNFRASYLSYLCPREEVLVFKYDVIRVEHIHPMLEVTFSIGKAFHKMYRDVYFGPMQEWGGAWKCLKCGWDTDKAGLSSSPVFKKKLVASGKMAKMPAKCGGCGVDFFSFSDNEDDVYGTFKEWIVADTNIGLEGHPDGWSLRNGSERVLVDLKSHGANGFSSRNTVREGHDFQVWAYQYLCGDKHGEVWYLNKSPWGDSLSFVRDIVVPFDLKKFRLFVIKPLEKVHNGIAGGELPERLCINSTCARAKECQLVDVCFEG